MIPGRRTTTGDMLKSVYDIDNNGIVDNAEKVNGFTVNINVPSNAKFTDTIYDDTDIKDDVTQLQTDLASKVDKISGKSLSTNDFTTTLKNKLDGIEANANNYSLPTANSTTLGGVKIGSNITISSGTISISKTNVIDALGYTPPTTNTTYDVATQSTNGLMSSADKLKLDTKVPVLDSNGLIPTSLLPSFVDDVLEYTNKSSFPATGETGKIYVDTTTNKTYRWGGSDYVEISASLALGTTSSTAFRGDYGNTAYTHAVTNKGSAFANGLYKITTNSEGHVTAATAVVKSDITSLGIPSSDTNTTYTLTQDETDGHILTFTPSSGTPTTITIPDNNTDTKVTISNTNPTTGTWYYPIWHTGTSGTNTMKANDGLRYHTLQGTADTVGTSYLQVGNTTASGTAGNKKGYVRICSENTGYGQIQYANTTSNTTHTLPSTSGVLLNSGTTSFTQTITSGTQIGAIKINGTTTNIYIPYNILSGTTEPTASQGNDGDIFILYE